MSKTRKGAQRVIDAVSDFAICVGTIVKPEKSFAYSTREGEEIKVRTMENKESGYSHHALKEIRRKDFFRHLGNIQTAEGRASVLNVDMYDGTKKEGIKQRQERNIRIMKARNITGAGAMQVLKVVIYKQIIYPAQFAQYTNKDIQKLQGKIDAMIRKHTRMSQRISSDIIHTHEQMGGI